MKNRYENLEFQFDLINSKPDDYKPSSFWKDALIKINETYKKDGIFGFRSDRVNLGYFVPTYGSPGNGFEKGIIKKLIGSIGTKATKKQKEYIKTRLDGSQHALSDYRVLRVTNKDKDPLDLLSFSESKIGDPIEHFCFEKKWFSRSSLNYLLGLSLLYKIDPHFKPKNILEIGGGFGTLAEIFGKSSLTGFKYLDLDLPPMFLIAKDYISLCFKDKLAISITKEIPDGKFTFGDLGTFSFLPNWKLEDLEDTIDLFVNFISFQEMEPSIVRNYANHIQRLGPKYILLRNMREGKQIASRTSVGVLTPILKEDYLKFFDKYVIIESNVLEYGFQTVDGFNSELLILKRNNDI